MKTTVFRKLGASRLPPAEIKQIKAAETARSLAIMSLCKKAGRPEMAPGFIRQQTSVALVQEKMRNITGWEKAYTAARSTPDYR